MAADTSSVAGPQAEYFSLRTLLLYHMFEEVLHLEVSPVFDPKDLLLDQAGLKDQAAESNLEQTHRVKKKLNSRFERACIEIVRKATLKQMITI